MCEASIIRRVLPPLPIMWGQQTVRAVDIARRKSTNMFVGFRGHENTFCGQNGGRENPESKALLRRAFGCFSLNLFIYRFISFVRTAVLAFLEYRTACVLLWRVYEYYNHVAFARDEAPTIRLSPCSAAPLKIHTFRTWNLRRGG